MKRDQTKKPDAAKDDGREIHDIARNAVGLLTGQCKPVDGTTCAAVAKAQTAAALFLESYFGLIEFADPEPDPRPDLDDDTVQLPPPEDDDPA